MVGGSGSATSAKLLHQMFVDELSEVPSCVWFCERCPPGDLGGGQWAADESVVDALRGRCERRGRWSIGEFAA